MTALETEAKRGAPAGRATGDALLLLHCTGGAGSHWSNVAQSLEARFRIIAPDLCGYGESRPWAGASAFRFADEVARLAPLTDNIAEPFHLVGHSYGGAVALQLARLHPERVASLTLIEPAAFHLLIGGDDADARALAEIGEIAAAIREAVRCGDYVRGMRRFVDYWGGEGAWAAIPDDKRAALIKRISKVALDFWAALNEPTRLDDFATLRIPALVLRGSHSPSPTKRICLHLARTLPNAELHTIDGAGHMLPLTHGATVVQSIIGLVERSRGRGYPSPGLPAALRPRRPWGSRAGDDDVIGTDLSAPGFGGQRWCDSIERELNNRLMGRGRRFGVS